MTDRLAAVAPTLRYLSLGAGRQSTALYLLACEGKFADPPTVAIFADTQDEPASIYHHLDRLHAAFGSIIPIVRVTAGRLSGFIGTGSKGLRFAAPPLFVEGRDGRASMLRRQCTREFKIAPIQKELRRMLGVAAGRRVPKGVIVESWQGISRDEATRMKDAPEYWVRHRYPLAMELGWSATDCHTYNVARGFSAPKSACVFCPYTDNSRWRLMKSERPEEFAQAVAFDDAIRAVGGPRGGKGHAFVHRSLTPLSDVDFRSLEDHGQENMFENECEGVCGV